MNSVASVASLASVFLACFSICGFYGFSLLWVLGSCGFFVFLAFNIFVLAFGFFFSDFCGFLALGSVVVMVGS